MMDKGLVVTVNSDDPAYFGGYVNENYRAVSDALQLGRDEIIAIVRNGIEASLMTRPKKDRALRRSTAFSPRAPDTAGSGQCADKRAAYR